MRESTPKFIQGIFNYKGLGFETSQPLTGYSVAPDKRGQVVYFRAGNSGDELAVISVLRDGAPMRLFPVGAKSSQHVPLAVVEDLAPDTKLGVSVSAPAGAEGVIALDVGLVEI